MPDFSTCQIPPPKDWPAFERLCRDLWAEVWCDQNAQLNGRQGQPQHGVDVSGRPNCGKSWAGVQCKDKGDYKPKGAKLSPHEIYTEVDKAKHFEPSLSEFTIATTASKDAAVEELARKITVEHLQQGLFSVHIWGWADIELALSGHRVILEKHYPQFFQTSVRKNEIATAASLNAVRNESIARCIASLQAAGVKRDKAEEYVGDPSFALVPIPIKDHLAQRLLLLMGDFGVGKSFALERMLQAAVDEALANTQSPVPIFVDCRNLRLPLPQHIQHIVLNDGDCESRGIRIFVDGNDEPGSSTRAVDLLKQARMIVSTWSNCTVVIASRPHSAFLRAEEAFKFPPLTEIETRRLIGRVADIYGDDRVEWMIRSWPSSVKEATTRPLFALLAASFLRSEPFGSSPRTRAELVSHIVKTIVPEIGGESVRLRQALGKIAAECLSKAKASVQIDHLDLESPVLELLSKSPIIRETDAGWGFSLPILLEWFAAQSLRARPELVPQLLKAVDGIEAWRGALEIAVGTFDFEACYAILKPIVDEDPGFASEIISKATNQWGQKDDADLSVSPIIAAQRVRSCMGDWLGAVEPLKHLIGPVDDKGNLLPSAVRVDEGRVMFAWYAPKAPAPEIIRMSNDWHSFVENECDFASTMGFIPARQQAWPWEVTLTRLRARLMSALDSRSLFVNAEPIVSEALWCMAIAAFDLYNSHSEPILVSELLERLQYLANLHNQSMEDLIISPFRGKRTYPVKHVLPLLNDLVNSGEVWLQPIRAVRGAEGRYERQTVLEHTRKNYEGAIRGYLRVVEQWFPRLKTRMQTYVKMPATLRGLLQWEDNGRPPRMQWFWETLPSDGVPGVSIQYGDPQPLSRTALQRQLEDFQFLRPKASTWLGASIQGGLIPFSQPDPSTEIIYSWLLEDLKEINWGEGFLHTDY